MRKRIKIIMERERKIHEGGKEKGDAGRGKARFGYCKCTPIVRSSGSQTCSRCPFSAKYIPCIKKKKKRRSVGVR
jgi:hypothetical protein